MRGEVLFDSFSRGRYATDASHYQMTPAGVVVPHSMDDAVAALQIAKEEGLPVTPRGGGTSQCGQTINSGLILDTSKHLTNILSLDVAAKTCRVEPGIVLDELNRQLKPHGLWFPIDVSTASRATIGGMAGNNSCGGRSLRYGTMRDNVIAIDAVLADGTRARFGDIDAAALAGNAPGRFETLARDMLALGRREADEIAARFPKVQRRVGGYNLDALTPDRPANNLAHLLVGSEGTLGFSTAIDLRLSALMGPRALGVCHFGSFYEAMEATRHLVHLSPIAIELVDATMIALGRDIAMFRPLLDRLVRGAPEALLLVEFAEESQDANLRRLADLASLMGDLGFAWTNEPRRWGGVLEVRDAATQAAIADFRASGLNVMMSMRQEGKPVSFVEDCAVPLEHLAEYTARLTEIFEKHGTRGTWYAHASVGCLHVRPILNLKLDKDLAAMRAIAEEAFAAVREYKGSHSGEHGDGIVRSEFHEPMYGARIVRAFEEVKERFDEDGVFNPGKIVRAPRFDDRAKLRYHVDYSISNYAPRLDWSGWPGGAGGMQGAAEMCNNNGACRKLSGGAMCPSYRATLDEQHVTRGRANVLRLALSGQLGADALASDDMMESLKLCVSCKACRRECPTGVDMARMKIEATAARARARGFSLRDRAIGWLPRYARAAAGMSGLMNLRDRIPALARASERWLGFSSQRSLPRWRRDVFAPGAATAGDGAAGEVALFADTFNRYFERDNLDAAVRVLVAAGYKVHFPRPADGSARPLCCGRTFLSVGAIDEARAEMRRTLAALAPLIDRGVPLVGLEPSCLLTFRDELTAVLPGAPSKALSQSALLFEEFIAREIGAGRFPRIFKPTSRKAYLHGHCHQKSFGTMGAVEQTLRAIPELDVAPIESSCCGMAGAFGYQAETIDVSRAMAELSLLPAVREAPSDALIVADGTSCRHQIADGAGRNAVHVARVLADALI